MEKGMQRVDLSSFYPSTRDARKVVVVDLGFLGDTVHLVPALWEIREHYPRAELHVLTSPVGCEVLRMAPCVDRAWAFPLGPPSPAWWEHWGLLRTLRRERFDVAFNFSGTDRSVFVTRALGARRTVIYQGARKHFWQPWLARDWIARTTTPSPVYEGRRFILALCGFTPRPARFDLRVPETEREWARATVPDGSVHLSLSASFALKEWPLANNVKLARFLLAEGFERRLVVTAAANARERARLEAFRREITDARLLIMNEGLSLARLAAMLERCAMHVGPDSGVIHLAWALGVPTVSIFRRYADMADFLPSGSKHVYFDAPCPCMGSKKPACSAANEAACLAGISAEEVGREIRRRLTPANCPAPE
jgi:ADP-heptose:LPS heptosyltransferase